MRALLLVGLVGLVAGTALAQDGGFPAPERPQVFLERSYFAPVSPTGRNMIFEGYASSHYFLINQLGDPIWQAKGGTAFTVPISMVFTVRMVNDFSSPVRTPSYQIRPLFVQAFHLRRDADRKSFWLFNESVGFMHYSNGQSGCTYQGFVEVNDDCVPVPDPGPIPAKRSFTVANTRDGSFSTNFIPLIFNVRRGRLRSARDPLDRQWSLGAEVQIHPIGGLPGSADIQQAATYGQHQFSVRGEREKRLGAITSKWIGVWRVAAEYTQRFGGNATNPPKFGAVETSYIFDRAGSFGGFVRFNAGRDYYNIHFQEEAKFLVFGLKWDLGRLDLLNSR
jgi:hypothetical protein